MTQQFGKVTCSDCGKIYLSKKLNCPECNLRRVDATYTTENMPLKILVAGLSVAATVFVVRVVLAWLAVK
jgi:hypothetical protein